MARTGLIWFRIGIGAGFCERGDEPSASTQFIDYVRTCQFLKQDSAVWSKLSKKVSK
jgi:hypothetical protein